MSGYLNQSDGGEEMINLNEILHRLVADYSELGEVVGLTMAGSKAASLQDDLSFDGRKKTTNNFKICDKNRDELSILRHK